MEEKLKREEVTSGFVDLVEWVAQHSNWPSKVMAGLLIGMGAKIAFDCAPNQEEAKMMIEEVVRASLADHLRNHKNPSPMNEG